MKTAVIVDGRLCAELFKSIDRHMNFLRDWRLVHIADKNIKTFQDYQMLFLSIAFWQSLSAKKVLIFQKDSEILRFGVEEFLDYDYSFIGAPWTSDAPWNTKDRSGGNGGISIRDVEQHIEILRTNPIENIIERHKENLLSRGLDKPSGKGLSEDVWFSHNLKKTAPYEVCRRFSVESEFCLGTFCAHAIDRHLLKEQCRKIRSQYRKIFV